MYISRMHGYYQQLVPQGYTPRDMAFLHVYQNGIYTVHALATSSLCHKGEIYTQGHSLHVYIRMGSTRCHSYYQLIATRRNIPRDMAFLHVYQNGIYTSSLCHREKYTPRDMAFLHVYIRMGSTVAATSYYQQLVPQGRNIHPGTWHSSMYISEWDLHGAATSYYQQLVPQGRNIHPGTWHSSMYIRMGSTRCRH
jgi:hypothetical protein